MFIDDDFEIIPPQIKKDELNKISKSLTKYLLIIYLQIGGRLNI